MRIITNVRIGRLGCFLVVLVLAAFLFVLSHFTFHASTTQFFNGVSHKFHHWFQKTVFNHNWEDIHCRKRFKNETHVEESWIKVISEQLNIKDGQAVFDCNTGCNEWLRALRKQYPNLKIGGAHEDQYAVEYAKRVFNDTPGTFFTVSREFGILESDSHTYDHAINYAGLRGMSQQVQCKLVKELLRIVKPGGSIYLGHNMEEKDCTALQKFAKYILLPGCYWTKCLQNRTDVEEIYYIKETDLYGPHEDINDCYTAVFIHKSVVINRVKNGPKNFPAKYKQHRNMYYCTPKPTDGIFDYAQQAILGKHVISDMHPRNLANSLKLFKNSRNRKNNTANAIDVDSL